jgi:molecular chaperone GrpE
MSKNKKHDSEERIEGLPVPDAVGGVQEMVKDTAPDTSGKTVDGKASGASEALLLAEQKLGAGEAKIAALEAEVSSLKDQYLRKLADYENFRKRMFRDKEDAVQYANTQILVDLVGVVDNFDRAVQSSETSMDFQSLHDGVDMIRKSLLGLLEGKYGLSRFDSLGNPFDPNMHEAVMSERGDCEVPVIVEEFVKGYKLHDRIVRSAKVKVCMPAQDAAATTGPEDSTNEVKA